MNSNALLIPNLSTRRSVARLHLAFKLQGLDPAPPEPVNIRAILLGDDPTLIDDTMTIYDALTERMGYAAFGNWLLAEHPYLESDCVSPLRRWWVLGRKLQEMG